MRSLYAFSKNIFFSLIRQITRLLLNQDVICYSLAMKARVSSLLSSWIAKSPLDPRRCRHYVTQRHAQKAKSQLSSVDLARFPSRWGTSRGNEDAPGVVLVIKLFHRILGCKRLRDDIRKSLRLLVFLRVAHWAYVPVLLISIFESDIE